MSRDAGMYKRGGIICSVVMVVYAYLWHYFITNNYAEIYTFLTICTVFTLSLTLFFWIMFVIELKKK